MFWRARTTTGRAICLSDRFPAIDVAEVMRGRLRFAGLPPADLGTEIDWTANPYGNRSWALNLHTLRWMGGLVAAYERTGDRACLDRATDVTAQWIHANPPGGADAAAQRIHAHLRGGADVATQRIRANLRRGADVAGQWVGADLRRGADVAGQWVGADLRGGADVSPWAWAEHAVALRAPVLVCLSEHVRTPALWDSLAAHGELLADPALYRAGHNHGLDQDIGLLTVGCRLGRARWRDLAVRRMTASAELAVDAQGVLHEQAPRYALYVHRRLGVALDAIARSGAETPAALVARRRAMESFIAHATQPDGCLTPIGDGPADTRAPGFPQEGPPVRVFDAGYVFGRTAWDDPRSAHYSIRFGPGRRLHGHEDHLGLTYSAQGRRILVEAGFHSYEKDDYTAWTRTPEAHNVPIPSASFRPGTPTRLVRSELGPYEQEFELTDDAYGVPRTRHILIRHGDDLMDVRDSVPSGTLRTLWHFDPSLRVIAQHPGAVVLSDAGDWHVTLLQSPPEGMTLGTSTIATGYLRTAEAVTVTSGEATKVRTVIVPGRTTDPVALPPL